MEKNLFHSKGDTGRLSSELKSYIPKEFGNGMQGCLSGGDIDGKDKDTQDY